MNLEKTEFIQHILRPFIFIDFEQKAVYNDFFLRKLVRYFYWTSYRIWASCLVSRSYQKSGLKEFNNFLILLIIHRGPTLLRLWGVLLDKVSC
jgi:hypothetical protein